MPDPKTVKVKLKVNASGGDLGVVGAVGDEVEVDAETAERWVAAGIAERGGAAEKPAEKENEKETGKETEPPAGGGGTTTVPRRSPGGDRK